VAILPNRYYYVAVGAYEFETYSFDNLPKRLILTLTQTAAPAPAKAPPPAIKNTVER